MTLKEILNITQNISSTLLAENATIIDTEHRWPEENIRAILEAGLGGLVVPRKYGGLGYGMEALAKVCEILGEECPSTALCFGMHCVGSAVIATKATEYQAETFLKPIANGKHITTLALSEPGTGAHFYFPQSKILPSDDEHFEIDGTKTFVTNGSHADSYVVSTMAATEEIHPDMFSCVVVPDSDKLTWGPEWDGFGMRGNSSRSMSLNNIKISRKNLLGEKGDQIWYVFNVVAPYFLTAMAGTYLGIGSAAVKETQAHLLNRNYKHSGHSLSQFQLIQYKLGNLWIMVERARRLLYYAVAQGDANDVQAIPAILASKAEIATSTVDVVNEAMTLVGGRGYNSTSKLPRLLRDARAAHVMAPTTDQLYTWIGRGLLQQPLLTD